MTPSEFVLFTLGCHQTVDWENGGSLRGPVRYGYRAVWYHNMSAPDISMAQQCDVAVWSDKCSNTLQQHKCISLILWCEWTTMAAGSLDPYWECPPLGAACTATRSSPDSGVSVCEVVLGACAACGTPSQHLLHARCLHGLLSRAWACGGNHQVWKRLERHLHVP